MTILGNLCANTEIAGTSQTQAVLEAVHDRIGTQKFDAWFKHGTCVHLEEDCLRIGAPNPFVAGWIESHFSHVMLDAAEEVTHSRPRLVVSVDPELGGRLRKRQLDAQARQVSQSTAGKSRRDPAPLPPTALRYNLADYVVGQSNRLAHSAAMAVAETGKASFNPLFIHGTCGVGKTHLLQGICNAVATRELAGRPIRWKYITAEQFTNDFVNAIRHKKLESFRQAYRALDVLAIDDVHFLAAKKATQEEFLHTFNTIESAGKQVILASDNHPKLVGQLAEQLVNRFLSGMVVKIDAPDRATRIGILNKLAARLQLAVPAEVITYVAEQIRGSVRELEGSLIKLSALADLAKQAITIDLAREALADHLTQTGSALTLGDIEAVVSTFFGITAAEMHSTRRTHGVSLARAVAMYLARRHTRMSYPEIGRFMGKNHSSAVLAVQRLEKLAVANAPCHWMSPAGPKSMPTPALLELLAAQIS